MIEDIERRISQIKSLSADLNIIINNSIRANAKFVIDLNVNQQLKGLNAKGGRIGTYADSTKKSRRRKGLQIGFVDLEDTKNYHQGFAIFYGTNYIELSSPDTMYSIFLDNRYKDLFGMDDESLDLLREKLRDSIYAEVNKRLS